MNADEKLTLWTVQDQRAWERAQDTGFLRGDGRRVANHLRPAYRWLIQQMTMRLTSYSGAYPIWAEVNCKPNLKGRRFEPNTPCVRVEFEASPQEVVISSYHLWERVMAGEYCPLSPEDESKMYTEKTGGSRSIWRDSIEPERAQLIKESWPRIFDTAIASAVPAWNRLQATLEEVRMDQVTEAVSFTSS